MVAQLPRVLLKTDAPFSKPAIGLHLSANRITASPSSLLPKLTALSAAETAAARASSVLRGDDFSSGTDGESPDHTHNSIDRGNGE
jgi:hypothetical protein